MKDILWNATLKQNERHPKGLAQKRENKSLYGFISFFVFIDTHSILIIQAFLPYFFWLFPLLFLQMSPPAVG